MDEETMPQNDLYSNSDIAENSHNTDDFAAYFLRRRLGVSLSHARVIAELLTGIGGAE
jgi:hypothetical protein